MVPAFAPRAAEASIRSAAAVADEVHNEVSAEALTRYAAAAADEARSVAVDAVRSAVAAALNPLAVAKPAAVSAAAAHNAVAAVHAEHPAEAFRAVLSFAFADAQASSCHADRRTEAAPAADSGSSAEALRRLPSDANPAPDGHASGPASGCRGHRECDPCGAYYRAEHASNALWHPYGSCRNVRLPPVSLPPSGSDANR